MQISLAISVSNPLITRIPYMAASGDVASGDYRVGGAVVPQASAVSVDSDAGTYFNVAGVLQTAAADALRVDYDPVTHAVRGVLAEIAITNGVFASNTFTDWAPNTSATFALDGTGPDGNACPRLTHNAADANSGFFKTFGAVVQGTTYTWSCVASYFSGAASFRFGSPSNLFGTGIQKARLDFNPQTGAFIAAEPGVSAYSITPIGNGRYFITVSAVCATASATHVVSAYHGVAAAGVNDVFGMQWETGAIAHSYLPTTTAPVTRAADALTFAASGTNNWTITFDDNSIQTFTGISGNWSPLASSLNRPRIKRWVAYPA